jgi:hypothetical protein
LKSTYDAAIKNAVRNRFHLLWLVTRKQPLARTEPIAPAATLDDFIRVFKPGDELILVNHIRAESGPRRIFELAFAPLAGGSACGLNFRGRVWPIGLQNTAASAWPNAARCRRWGISR